MTDTYMIKLDVRYELEVRADTVEEALEKARHFQETMPKGWGDSSEGDVSWIDTLIVKEITERSVNV